MHRSRFVVCAAALAWMAALGSSNAATLSVKGGGGTGGGTIVRGGTGDASNTDQSATGSTDTLAALGFNTPTLSGLTTDLQALQFFVTVTNPDPVFLPADAALIQSFKVFFTTPSPCSLSSVTNCDPISSIEEGFTQLKYDTGPPGSVDDTAETVVGTAQFATGVGIQIPFDTTVSFSLTNSQAAALAGFLLAAYPQGFPGSPLSGDPNFLNLVFLGFSVQTIGVNLDPSTPSGYQEFTNGAGQTFIDPVAPVNTFITTNPVPEPGTLTLLGTGLLSVATAARRRRKGGRS